MKVKQIIAIGLAAGALAVFGAGKGASAPVCDKFVNWQGVEAKNLICGRALTPSDLRHRIVAIYEFEYTTELAKQLEEAAKLAALSSYAQLGESGWETLEKMPRNVIFVGVHRGDPKFRAEVVQAVKAAKLDKPIFSFYEGITFEGAPNAEKTLPYAYVMGTVGKEPLYSGKFDDASGAIAAVTKAKSALASQMYQWNEFLGPLAVKEAKNFGATVAAAAKARKPMKPTLAALAKEIAGKDAEKAEEAQILYDAIVQTKSDLVLRIRMEALACPHRAIFDAQRLFAYWPAEKKKVGPMLAKAKLIPDVAKLSDMYLKLMKYGDANFTCKNAGEAKKIVAELNKMKKDLEKIKASKLPPVAAGAAYIDSQLDTLISTVPSKLPKK